MAALKIPIITSRGPAHYRPFGGGCRAWNVTIGSAACTRPADSRPKPVLIMCRAGGCSNSYRFEDNGASTAPAEVEAPTRNGNPQQKMQECDASCQAEGQSTGGG